MFSTVGKTATFDQSVTVAIITTRKKEAVFQVLMLHYDVLFSDTDVAIVRNPFPYLLWENVDYVHSLNCICEYQKSEEKLIDRS